MNEEMFTVEDLADFLKLSKTKVFQMIKDGQLPYIKLGGTYRFVKSTIIDHLKSKEETAKSKKSSLIGRGPKEVRV